MKNIDVFLDNLFKTDINIDVFMFWTIIIIGILITFLICAIGCQFEDIMMLISAKFGKKKKKNKNKTP